MAAAKRVFAKLPEIQTKVEDAFNAAHLDSTTIVVHAAKVTTYPLGLHPFSRQSRTSMLPLNAPAVDAACSSVLPPMPDSISYLVTNGPIAGILEPPQALLLPPGATLSGKTPALHPPTTTSP